MDHNGLDFNGIQRLDLDVPSKPSRKNSRTSTKKLKTY